MKALINVNVFDYDSYKENQYVLFHNEIIDVGPMSEFKAEGEVIECRGCIVMPGLINCHTHIYSTFARGINISFDPKSFKDILDKYWWKIDRSCNKATVYYSGLINGYESLSNGVTTIIDHHASGIDITGTLDELKKSLCNVVGMRGIFCFETSDRFDINKCIDENLKFTSYRTEKSAGLFGMHASMSLNDKTLKKIQECIEDLPIHIHVAESIEDENDCMQKYGITVIERLQNFNLLKENSILAHCVHINEVEADIIAKSKAYVAINPTSNMNNAVGLVDYRLLKERNIPCIIGNDGLGTNITREYLNLFFGMKSRFKSPAAFTLEDLRVVIDNGYKYASKTLGIKLGRIKKGYKADMLIVPYNAPTNINIDNAFEHVFYGVFDNFHPREVYCDGNCLIKNYNTKVNIKEVYSKAQQEADRLWERIAEGG
ncbi:amidohydrolase family protein [Clostridium algoriphilum]|uniref:amidohydrolase family protein n=1 Tax=Clostridium algoriphilum TaxID=198347 RepID=UPI001CF24B80|nr:amidohydrolase family protein [Clostridium algoriphilum]MCB2293276.1 amidohydrolase family protein [Clostridium algoriphilum]